MGLIGWNNRFRGRELENQHFPQCLLRIKGGQARGIAGLRRWVYLSPVSCVFAFGGYELEIDLQAIP